MTRMGGALRRACVRVGPAGLEPSCDTACVQGVSSEPQARERAMNSQLRLPCALSRTLRVWCNTSTHEHAGNFGTQSRPAALPAPSYPRHPSFHPPSHSFQAWPSRCAEPLLAPCCNFDLGPRTSTSQHEPEQSLRIPFPIAITCRVQSS
jgi:hypothetical protein